MANEKGLSKLAEFHHAVTACFEAEDADMLYQALALAERAQDLEAAAVMEATLEYISTHQYMEDGHSFTVVSLIAVPVFMEIPAPFALDNPELCRNAAFADFEQTFQKMGLVGNSATVVLQNYLYYPHELANLSYFDVAALTVNLQASLLEGIAMPPGQLGQTGEGSGKALSDNQSRIELRYLLGVIRDNTSDLPFESRGGRFDALFEKRLADWKEWVLQLLPECLDFDGRMNLDVLKPQLFYEAYRQGLKALLNSDLYYSMVNDLAQMGVLSEARLALIVPCSKGEAPKCMAFVYTQEKDKLLLARGRNVLPFENTKEAQVDLALVLKAVGIEEVIVPEEQQDWRVDCLPPAVHDTVESDERYALITLAGNDTVH